MNEYLTGVEVPSLSRKVKRGKKFFTYTWRWMLGLPIRDGKDALDVNWPEITIRDSNGKITYRNSFVTDLPTHLIAPYCQPAPAASPRNPVIGGSERNKAPAHPRIRARRNAIGLYLRHSSA
jgi:hypothetical protein